MQYCISSSELCHSGHLCSLMSGANSFNHLHIRSYEAGSYRKIHRRSSIYRSSLHSPFQAVIIWQPCNTLALPPNCPRFLWVNKLKQTSHCEWVSVCAESPSNHADNSNSAAREHHLWTGRRSPDVHEHTLARFQGRKDPRWSRKHCSHLLSASCHYKGVLTTASVQWNCSLLQTSDSLQCLGFACQGQVHLAWWQLECAQEMCFIQIYKQGIRQMGEMKNKRYWD